MDLSRHNDFRLCSRYTLGDKDQFGFIAPQKIALESAPLTVSRLYVFQCNMATPKPFAYNLLTTITQQATNSLRETFKLYQWWNLQPITEFYKLGLLTANIADLFRQS